jgi:ADP-heptose:LPS heptosyltransferase
LEFIGAPAQGDALEFPVSADDRREISAIEGCAELRERPYVCVHAGARQPQRRWAPERFAAVGDALASHGLAVVLTGTAEERAIADDVERRMQQQALNLAGRTNLGSLAALLASSRVLVCNDTGVSHLADALRVPSVIVFTGSEPERWAPADRDLHRVLRGIGIDVDSVLREADALLTTEAAHAA